MPFKYINMKKSLIILVLMCLGTAFAQDPSEIIRKSNDAVKVSSFEAVSTLTISDSKGNQRIRQSAMASMTFPDGTEKRIIKFLSPAEVERLHRAIQSVLRAAIASGGTTLADAAYQRADGSAGEFAERLAVYGRGEQPCPRCGSIIESARVSQRGTCFCPGCQPLLQDTP